jgi:hypothetical protein
MRRWKKIEFTELSGRRPASHVQQAADFSLILLPFSSCDKAEPVGLEGDPPDFKPPARPVLKDAAE